MHLQQQWLPTLREIAPLRARVSPFVLHPSVRPFMPRDSDKNNDSRGRRDRPPGGKSRSGAARGPEKKFAKRGFAGRDSGGRDSASKDFAGKRDGDKRSFGEGRP